jgi:anti-sigma factor RsiW
MMPCGEFEDRLLDYASLPDCEREMIDAHLAGCSACRMYFDTLERVDSELDRAFASIEAPAGWSETVLRRTRTPEPSVVPELLDGIGWLGVLALLACVAFFLPGVNLVWAASAISVFLGAVIWISILSHAELKN